MKNNLVNQDIKTDKPLVMSYEDLKADRDALKDKCDRLEYNLGNALIGEQETIRRADALAVENAAVKAMNDCLSEELRGYESDGAFEGPNMHLLWWKSETPATSAALAAIEARGVAKAIDLLLNKFSGTGHIGVPVMALESLAVELREAK